MKTVENVFKGDKNFWLFINGESAAQIKQRVTRQIGKKRGGIYADTQNAILYLRESFARRPQNRFVAASANAVGVVGQPANTRAAPEKLAICERERIAPVRLSLKSRLESRSCRAARVE